jgi:hypothetical protein
VALASEKTNPPSPRLRRDSFSLTREWGRGAVDCAWHAPLHAARKDAGPPRPVIDFRRRRRGRCFTLGGGSADGVRVRVFATRVPCASSRLFMFGGLLLRLLNRVAENHARSHRSSHRFEHWPTALQRSDGCIMRQVWRCRIDFVRVVWNQRVGWERCGIEALGSCWHVQSVVDCVLVTFRERTVRYYRSRWI